MRPIFLIGYMACGKTTLGHALSKTYDTEFIDLDDYIAERSGMTPAQWFAGPGEPAFRQAEYSAIAEICDHAKGRSIIVATGGGTPCNGNAMELMLDRGTVVWLRASLKRTVARLLDADGQRPVVAGMDEAALLGFIPRHFEEREPWYSRAHAEFDSSFLDTQDEIDASVDAFGRMFLQSENNKK